MIGSPCKSDSGESRHSEEEKSREGENISSPGGPSSDEVLNLSTLEDQPLGDCESPTYQGKSSNSEEENLPVEPGSPFSDNGKTSSPRSPSSERSYQSGSQMSEDVRSPNSNDFSDDNGNIESPGSVQSQEDRKSSEGGSDSPLGSVASSPGSRKEGSTSPSQSEGSRSRSGSPHSSTRSSGASFSPSPSPEGSVNSPASPGSDSVEDQNSPEGVGSPGSAFSYQSEEDTLKHQSENSSSPDNSSRGSPASNEPTSPQSNESRSHSEASGSPRSVHSGSDGSPRSYSGESYGSPEGYPESPGSKEDENLEPHYGSIPYSPSSKSEHSDSSDEIDNYESISKSELLNDEGEPIEIKIEPLEDSDSSTDENIAENAIEESKLQLKAQNDDDSCSETESESSSTQSEDSDKSSVSESSSDSWDSCDDTASDDSCDSEYAEANKVDGDEELADLALVNAEENVDDNQNVDNFQEKGESVPVDEDSDNWEDLDSSSQDESSEIEYSNDSETGSEGRPEINVGEVTKEEENDNEVEDLVEADDEDSGGSEDSESEHSGLEHESETSSDVGSEENGPEETDSDLVYDSSSDSWDSYGSDDSWNSEDIKALLNEIECEEKLRDAADMEENVDSILSTENFEKEGKALFADEDSDNWLDVNSLSASEEEKAISDAEKSEKINEGDDENIAAEDQKEEVCESAVEDANALDTTESKNESDTDEVGEVESEDWEFIDDNNNITEEESDGDGSSSSSDQGEEEKVLIKDESGDVSMTKQESNDTNDNGGFPEEDSIPALMDSDAEVDSEQLFLLMNSLKTQTGSVDEFTKLKMKEYLSNSGFIKNNLNEIREKIMDPKDLAELISKQDNNLNAVSLGPDYEPEEIKGEINRFWEFYHSLKNSNPDLGDELTPFLVPMLIYFYVELITNSLSTLAADLFTLFGAKFISEGGDERFIEELTALSEIKDEAEFEKNESLHSLPDRKYAFTLDIKTYEIMAKFLAKSQTPVLISLFTDRFIVKLRFPEVEKVKLSESSDIEEVESDESENKEDSDSSYFDEDDIKDISYTAKVIRKLRRNTIVDMPSLSVYTTNGRPLCGAMSVHGTMVAYGMDPTGIRLCKTAKAQHFSDEDKENENLNQSAVLTLNAHEGCVYDVAFHPKTKLLFSVGYDGFMRAWDLRKDKPANRCVYSGHIGAVWSMDIADSGSMIATGGMDTTARLWLPERQDFVRIFVGHYFDVDTVKFHPNEAYIATGSLDKSVRLWSISDGNMVRMFTGCPGRVSALAFHGSGKYIAGGGEDNVVRIWDIAQGDLLYELPSKRNCKDLSFYENKLAGCFDKSVVQIWDLKHLVGGDIESLDSKEESDEAMGFSNTLFEDDNTYEKEITITAPFSISCNTEYVFKVNFKDAANVYCLGAERRPVIIDRLDDEDEENSPPGSPEDSSDSSEDDGVPLPPLPVTPEDDDSSDSPPPLCEYPFSEGTHPVIIENAEESSANGESSAGCSVDTAEAPSTMYADEIDTTEADTIKAEVATYDKLAKMRRTDDDTWLSDL